MSNWRTEWRNSALYDDIGDKIDEWVAKAAPYGDSVELEDKYWEPVIKAIEKVLETVESEAIAAEREECAKIADALDQRWGLSHRDVTPHASEVAEQIAAAIRARGQTT